MVATIARNRSELPTPGPRRLEALGLGRATPPEYDLGGRADDLGRCLAPIERLVRYLDLKLLLDPIHQQDDLGRTERGGAAVLATNHVERVPEGHEVTR